MSDAVRKVLKGTIGVVWVWAVASFWLPAGSWTRFAGQFAFWVMVVVHAIELGFFWPTLRQVQPLAGHVLGVMLFGYVHFSGVKRSAGSSA